MLSGASWRLSRGGWCSGEGAVVSQGAVVISSGWCGRREGQREVEGGDEERVAAPLKTPPRFWDRHCIVYWVLGIRDCWELGLCV